MYILMTSKFLISKILYNLYDYPKYPKFIRIINANINYTKFNYIYNDNNKICANEIDIENLFRYFNVLKPEMVMSLKKINNRLYLILNRYRSEDEDLYKEIGCRIDLLKTKLEKHCSLEYVDYVFLNKDNSIRFKNENTLQIRYVYFDDEIENILNSIILDRDIIKYILIDIYEFIGKLLHLFIIDNENAIKNILYLNDYGKNFLLYITNKIIDFNTINILIYDYKYDIKKLFQKHNGILLKYKNIIYILIFKEKNILDRTEVETGFNKNELMMFLRKKID